MKNAETRVIPYQKRKDNYQPNSITTSKQTYTKQEKRLFAYVVSQFNHQDHLVEGQNVVFVLPISEVTKFIGYKELKKVCETIMEKKIFIKNEKDSFDAIIPFPRIKYNVENSGNIEVTMFADIIPFFMQLGKEYTRYSLEIMLSLSSKYSQRIFEYLRMYHGRKTYEFEVQLEPFKEEIDATQYKNLKDFRKNVLLPAQKELLEKAGISFEFNTLGKVRNIDKIQFRIITWKDVQQQEYEADLQNFAAATPQAQFHGVRSLLQEHYTFKAEQIDRILKDEKLMQEFVRINGLIETGLVEVTKSRTAYMASCLGLGKR